MNQIDLTKHSKRFVDGYAAAIRSFEMIKTTAQLRKQAESDEDCDFQAGWLAACHELENQPLSQD